MSPTDEQALQALRTLRAWLGIGASVSRATYDADHRPAGVTRDAYLRRHAARVRDGVAGWSRVGHGRVVTREAWDADVKTETARRHTRSRLSLVSSPSISDALDRALGIRTTQKGGAP